VNHLWFVKSRRAQNENDDETWIKGGVCTTLNAFDNGGESRATVLIIDGTRVGDVRVTDEETMQTVIQRWGTGGGNVPAIMTKPLQVRRLTPMECERLQGFPDGWTETQSDSQRYRQMGNAVTVNVIESIGQQLVKVEDGQL
jgi:site-specific DNA-cytosine methylase